MMLNHRPDQMRNTQGRIGQRDMRKGRVLQSQKSGILGPVGDFQDISGGPGVEQNILIPLADQRFQRPGQAPVGLQHAHDPGVGQGGFGRVKD